MAQPPLSRAIARLERQLGVTLLERTSRKVTLTGAGAVLLSEGRVILSAVAAAERRTQQAARRRPRLVLVVKCGTAGELLAALLDAYRAESGAATVDPTVGLDTETLHTEGQVVVLPTSHPLAGPVLTAATRRDRGQRYATSRSSSSSSLSAVPPWSSPSPPALTCDATSPRCPSKTPRRSRRSSLGPPRADFAQSPT